MQRHLTARRPSRPHLVVGGAAASDSVQTVTEGAVPATLAAKRLPSWLFPLAEIRRKRELQGLGQFGSDPQVIVPKKPEVEEEIPKPEQPEPSEEKAEVVSETPLGQATKTVHHVKIPAIQDKPQLQSIEDGEACDEGAKPGSTLARAEPSLASTTQADGDSANEIVPDPAEPKPDSAQGTELGSTFTGAEDNPGRAEFIGDVYVRPYKGTSRPPGVLPELWNAPTTTRKMKKRMIEEYNEHLRSL